MPHPKQSIEMRSSKSCVRSPTYSSSEFLSATINFRERTFADGRKNDILLHRFNGSLLLLTDLQYERWTDRIGHARRPSTLFLSSEEWFINETKLDFLAQQIDSRGWNPLWVFRKYLIFENWVDARRMSESDIYLCWLVRSIIMLQSICVGVCHVVSLSLRRSLNWMRIE